MRLEQSDAELFYQLWFPLLDFVNKKYHVCPETETIDQRQGVDASDAKAIADYLWSHIEVIEEYLAIAELPKEYAQIIAGWKQCKPGRYILERHLKKGSVFISVEDGAVYMVKGLFSTWAERHGRKFCVRNFRQTQEYYSYDVHNRANTPCSPLSPSGWNGMRAGTA